MSDEPEKFVDNDRIERVADDAEDDFEGHQLGGDVGRLEDAGKFEEAIEVERLGNENERIA